MVEKWKVLTSETVFSAKPFLEVIKESVETDKAEIIDDFYQLKLRSFALCIPILPDGKILTLRQYKHGAGEICMTFPAGHVEEGEDAAYACERELLEETGYAAERLTPLGSFVDNGNQRGCMGHYFLAENCIRKQEPQSGDLEEMIIESHSGLEIEQAFAAGEIMIAHHGFGWLLAQAHIRSTPNKT